MQKNIEEGRVEFIKQPDGSWIAYEKIFAPREGEEAKKNTPHGLMRRTTDPL